MQVVVVSKAPLPNYRADLDAKLVEQVQVVGMSGRERAMVESVLQGMPSSGAVSGIKRESGAPADQPVKRKKHVCLAGVCDPFALLSGAYIGLWLSNIDVNIGSVSFEVDTSNKVFVIK